MNQLSGGALHIYGPRKLVGLVIIISTELCLSHLCPFLEIRKVTREHGAPSSNFQELALHPLVASCCIDLVRREMLRRLRRRPASPERREAAVREGAWPVGGGRMGDGNRSMRLRQYGINEGAL